MYSCLSPRALGLTLSAEQTIALAASNGFAAVELLVRDLVLEGADLPGLRARMEDVGIHGAVWPLPVDWRGDESRFAHDLAQLDELADAAASLGLTRTGTWIMPEVVATSDRRADFRTEWTETFDLHVTRLSAIGRVLQRHGIRLGLEVIGVESSRTGRSVPFICRLADVDGLLEALRGQCPDVGILLDPFHLFAAGEEWEAGLWWGVDSIIAVHLADLPAGSICNRRSMKDRERGLPGDHGAIDAQGLLRELAGRGYEGPVIAEPFAGCSSLSGMDPATSIRRVAAALQSVWPNIRQPATPRESTQWTGRARSSTEFVGTRGAISSR